MIHVDGLSERINSDQPVMHVTRVDQPRPSTGPKPVLSADYLTNPDCVGEGEIP
jgi:hypothetical protein